MCYSWNVDDIVKLVLKGRKMKVSTPGCEPDTW